MIGLQIAFRDYVPRLGYWDSTWLGLAYFDRFFSFYSAWQIILNTLVLSALMAGLISALTVGGKAIMKGIAVKNADKIMEFVGRVLDVKNWGRS